MTWNRFWRHVALPFFVWLGRFSWRFVLAVARFLSDMFAHNISRPMRAFVIRNAKWLIGLPIVFVWIQTNPNSFGAVLGPILAIIIMLYGLKMVATGSGLPFASGKKKKKRRS